jgi:predicted metal-dependent hydrolase
VRAFCGQEAVHSREHERFNAALEARGLPVRELEQRVYAGLQEMRSTTSRRWQLAVTCALEHFTAIMADVALRDPAQLEGAPPVMVALWRWHAVEETEHKSVAFDVYQATGGDYRTRALAMALTTLAFWATIIDHQRQLMAADGCARDVREIAALIWFLFGRPGGLRKIVRPWLAYFRPGFHPDDHDNHELIEAWKQAEEAAPYQQHRPGAAA